MRLLELHPRIREAMMRNELSPRAIALDGDVEELLKQTVEKLLS